MTSDPNHEHLTAEFDRQIATLLEKDYPGAAGLTTDEFLTRVAPFRGRLEQALLPEANLEAGRLPFVLVVRSSLVAAATAMTRTQRQGKSGVVKLYPRQPQDFLPIAGLSLPPTEVYLLTDIDRGQETINLAPAEALGIIRGRQRSPLTIDEGVAILTHYPDFLRKNHCFSLLASRIEGDKRVPAIWINQKKEPNLGWCWDGNPHTWLGSASGGRRF